MGVHAGHMGRTLCLQIWGVEGEDGGEAMGGQLLQREDKEVDNKRGGRARQPSHARVLPVRLVTPLQDHLSDHQQGLNRRHQLLGDPQHHSLQGRFRAPGQALTEGHAVHRVSSRSGSIGGDSGAPASASDFNEETLCDSPR